MDVLNDPFALDVRQQLDEIASKHSTRITSEQFYSHTPYLKRVQQQAAYLAIRFLFFLFTFYFKQEK
jgi:cardiolipin synthase